MNRTKKQELLIRNMKKWNHDELLDWAQETMGLILDELTDEEIDLEYDLVRKQ